MKIIVSVFDGVYGRPAAGVEVSVLREPAAEPSSRYAGLTDAFGTFICPATSEDLSRGQHCTVRLNVDSYFASLGIVAGYKKAELEARIIDSVHEHRVMAVITPFTHTTWLTR
jgi:5-hydroxyisourate hydrolase-like protein (transthyretin family)